MIDKAKRGKGADRPQVAHSVRKIHQLLKREYSPAADADDIEHLFADLRHYCESRGVDFYELERASYLPYLQERGE